MLPPTGILADEQRLLQVLCSGASFQDWLHAHSSTGCQQQNQDTGPARNRKSTSLSHVPWPASQVHERQLPLILSSRLQPPCWAWDCRWVRGSTLPRHPSNPQWHCQPRVGMAAIIPWPKILKDTCAGPGPSPHHTQVPARRGGDRQKYPPWFNGHSGQKWSLGRVKMERPGRVWSARAWKSQQLRISPRKQRWQVVEPRVSQGSKSPSYLHCPIKLHLQNKNSKIKPLKLLMFLGFNTDVEP
jgi:hypothetical protein